MSCFEKIQQIEKHLSIELSDEMIKEGFVYREPIKDDNLTDYVKKKYELAKFICDNTHILNIGNKCKE